MNLKFLIRLLSKLMPKNDYKILFISTPDFSDSVEFFYRFIEEKHSKKYKCIWVSKKSVDSRFICKPNTLNFIWQLISARYIVSSHNHYISLVSPSTIYISLLHGFYWKSFGYLFTETKQELETFEIGRKTISICPVVSQYHQTVVAGCLHLSKKQMPIIGLPRYDYLNQQIRYEKEKKLKWGSKKEKQFMRAIYLPTHHNHIKNEEQRDSCRMVIELLESQLLFNEYRDIEIHVKMHPFEVQWLKENISDEMRYHQRLKFIDLIYDEFDLYKHINEYDCIISDFSSVFIDAIYINKPIISLAPVGCEYTKDRGLMFSPISFWFPSPAVTTWKDCFEMLHSGEHERECYNSKRLEIRRVLFSDFTNKPSASESLYKAVFSHD